MFIQSTASPTDARKNFFGLLEQVANNHEVVVVRRREGENVALIAESDLASLYETAYLLKSPKNAQRLQDALARSRSSDEQPSAGISPQDAIAQLKQEIGIGQEEE